MGLLLDTNDANAILEAGEREEQAAIIQGRAVSPNEVQKFVLDLSTARAEADPYPLQLPFRTLYIADATDNAATVSVRPGTRQSGQSAFPMGRKDSFYRSKPFSGAYLFWDAQPGKTITVLVFLKAEFRSGSQISVNSGGVSLNDGSTVGVPTKTTLVGAAAAVTIAPADANRKVCTLQNETGGDLYVGGAGVNATTAKGIRYAPGEIFQHRNTAALYGFSVGGGDVTRVEEA